MGAGGRRFRAWWGVAGAAVLLVAAYLTIVAPLRESTSRNAVSASQAPPGAASLAPGSPSWPAGPVPTDGGAPRADPSGVPMPVGDLPGWRQVFTDDFNRTTLGPRWDAYTGQPDNDPGGYFDPGHVGLGGGLLTIGAWPDPARNGIYVTGGVSNRNSLADTYGRFDIRFRMDAGTGIAYALLLWPKDNNYPPEIDIGEDNGRDRSVLYSNVHPNVGDPIQNTVNGNFTQWHTISLQWTPRSAVFTVDGQTWATVTGPDVPDEPMALALQSQAWYCGQSWEACPDATTPPRVNLEIDWVVIYEQVGN